MKFTSIIHTNNAGNYQLDFENKIKFSDYMTTNKDDVVWSRLFNAKTGHEVRSYIKGKFYDNCHHYYGHVCKQKLILAIKEYKSKLFELDYKSLGMEWGNLLVHYKNDKTMETERQNKLFEEFVRHQIKYYQSSDEEYTKYLKNLIQKGGNK